MNKRRRPGRLRRHQLSSHSKLTSQRKTFSFEPLEIRTLLSGISIAGVPDWVEQGPRPMINNGNTVIPPNNPAAGAVEGIAINPNPNPDGTSQVFLATVNGGVWRSDNLSTNNPGSTAWTPLTDQLGFMGTSSIAFSPLDPSDKTLFVGSTSLSAYGDADSAGLGVLRTTDGGNTWQSFAVSANEPEVKTVLPTAINLASSGPVQEMVLVGGINPQGGLYRSDNNGQTFSLLSGANGLPVGQVSQLIADPGNAQRFYAALPGLGVYEGDFNAGTKVINWTAFNTNIPAAAISASTDVQITAVDVSGATELYLAMTGNTSAITAVYRSSDTNANWTSLGAPAGLVAGNLNQHAFNLVGDPTDNQVVYIAGLGSVGTNGAIFRYDTGSTSWVNITGAGANNTQPHPDSRDMVFLGPNDLLESSDGGLYFLSDPQNAATSSWGSLNGEGTAGQGLGVNEFHDIAWDSNSNVIMAGAQDNGAGFSQVINTNSPQISGGVWKAVDPGDGGDVAVDDYTLASSGQSVRFSSSQGNSTPPLDFLTRQTFNASGAPTSAPTLIQPTGLSGFNGLFITPTVLNTIPPTAAQLATGQSTRMVIGGYQSANPIYESNNVGSAAPANIMWAAVPVAPTFGDTVTALAYGGMLNGVANADVLYAGGSKFVGKQSGLHRAFCTLVGRRHAESDS